MGMCEGGEGGEPPLAFGARAAARSVGGDDGGRGGVNASGAGGAGSAATAEAGAASAAATAPAVNLSARVPPSAISLHAATVACDKVTTDDQQRAAAVTLAIARADRGMAAVGAALVALTGPTPVFAAAVDALSVHAHRRLHGGL